MFFLYIILFHLLFFFYFFLLPRFLFLDGFSFFGMDGLVQYTLRALDTQSFWLFFQSYLGSSGWKKAYERLRGEGRISGTAEQCRSQTEAFLYRELGHELKSPVVVSQSHIGEGTGLW